MKNAGGRNLCEICKVINMSKAYVRPTLSVQGKLEAMTHGASDGNALDQSFPVDTPKNQLTFS